MAYSHSSQVIIHPFWTGVCELPKRTEGIEASVVDCGQSGLRESWKRHDGLGFEVTTR